MIIVAFCCVTIPLLTAALGVAYWMGVTDERHRHNQQARLAAAAIRSEQTPR